MAQTARADYGLDAPGIVRGFLIGGAALIVAGVAVAAASATNAATIFGRAATITGAICLIEGVLMWWSSRVGKMHARDRLLDDLHLRGDERVLDVGCGRGVLLIGAARRVPQGAAVGLDLWSQSDQGDNRPDATLANARAEGVAERVTIESGDMRRMPFPDAAFACAVANLSIHNIESRDGRREAIGEIARVLVPGGRVALMDFKHVGQYADDLRTAGLTDVRVSGPNFWIFPPVRTVTGEK